MNEHSVEGVRSALLAAIYGQLKGGTGGANAMAMSKAFHNGYSRDDEREADAFGVLAAWHAGRSVQKALDDLVTNGFVWRSSRGVYALDDITVAEFFYDAAVQDALLREIDRMWIQTDWKI